MFKANSRFEISGRPVGNSEPTYFVADIAANHDGDLQRAKDLIWLCKEAGADAAKFQHFKASTIVSDYGFKNLKSGMSHQEKWKKSVFEVYQDASVNLDWTEQLVKECQLAGIEFFTTPYAIDIVDRVDDFVQAYKIGSGDITWIELIEYVAAKAKPCLLATGAATLDDVIRSVEAITKVNSDLVLMQCNTNYTGDIENLRFVNLNVLRTYREMFPTMILGLSDHTPGHATVLGAIALGARVIEKHFTDDVNRSGPDHKFSMDPKTWKDMVDRSRELEASLGGGVKKVEDNEKDTVVVQRRSIRLANSCPAGHVLQEGDLEFLRPCQRCFAAVYDWVSGR